MIRSFADRETECVWRARRSRRLPHDIQRVGLHKMQMINAAESVEDLRNPPGNRLEKLRGDRQGQCPIWGRIRINDQWRVCFKWENGHASEVEIADYHR